MKCFLKSWFVLSVLSVGLCVPSTTIAADAKPKAADAPAAAPAESPKPKRDWYPFRGTVGSVDKQAKTVSLKKKEGERVIRLDAKSEIEVYGKPGTLADVKVGDYAHGKLHKDASGKEFVLSVKFDKEAPHNDHPAGDKDKAPEDKPTNKNKK